MKQKLQSFWTKFKEVNVELAKGAGQAMRS